MEKIWLRQEGESSKAFSTFKMYLEMGERNLSKLAENLSVSKQSLQQWATKYDWKNRAIAYDNALFEENRQVYLKRYNTFLDKQFSTNEKIQARLMKIFLEKDLDRISWRSLNDVWRSNFMEMVDFANTIGLKDNDSGDKEYKIIIERAT